MDLPFEDCSFDAATMGYGLRNVASIPAALRVGGRPGQLSGCVAGSKAVAAAGAHASLLRCWQLLCLPIGSVLASTPASIQSALGRLQELHRVLRPGCSVAILDFNNAADNPVVDATQVCTQKLVAVLPVPGGRAPCCMLAESLPGQQAPHPPSSHPPRQAFFLESLVVPRARQLGVAEEYE